jgi:hypothetical protein
VLGLARSSRAIGDKVQAASLFTEYAQIRKLAEAAK